MGYCRSSTSSMPVIMDKRDWGRTVREFSLKSMNNKKNSIRSNGWICVLSFDKGTPMKWDRWKRQKEGMKESSDWGLLKQVQRVEKLMRWEKRGQWSETIKYARRKKWNRVAAEVFEANQKKKGEKKWQKFNQWSETIEYIRRERWNRVPAEVSWDKNKKRHGKKKWDKV